MTRWMVAQRYAAVLALAVLGCAAACRDLLPRQYEYDEEIYLSLDGSATVYVNASVPALVALRGIEHDVNPRARFNRAAIRRAYESDVTDVTRLSSSRRSGRRFVHLRLAVSDVRRLAEVAPFAWSAYEFGRQGDEFVYKQRVGPAAGRDVGDVGWDGTELVAFRMHLPSKIRYHDAPSKEVERGNIVVWEQTLPERRAGAPLGIEVRVETQSILYRTLWLFGLMMVLVLGLFAVVITWVLRKGREREQAAAP
jgi:hypothetical protein